MKKTTLIIVLFLFSFLILGCADKRDRSAREMIKKDVDIMVKQSQNSYAEKGWGTIKLDKLEIDLLDNFKDADGNYFYVYKVKTRYLMKFDKNLSFGNIEVHSGSIVRKEETYGYKMRIGNFGGISFNEVKTIDTPRIW